MLSVIKGCGGCVVLATERAAFALESAFQILPWQTFQVTDLQLSLLKRADRVHLKRGRDVLPRLEIKVHFHWDQIQLMLYLL